MQTVKIKIGFDNGYIYYVKLNFKNPFPTVFIDSKDCRGNSEVYHYEHTDKYIITLMLCFLSTTFLTK